MTRLVDDWKVRGTLATALLAVAAGGAGATDTDWPAFGNDLANGRYSQLQQLTTDNVANLQLAWRVDTGKRGSFQATPIVRDGVMYVSTPFNHVLALDAATGAIRWRYEHELTTKEFCCGPANRGVAVAHDRVYMATLDGQLVALDAATGQLAWRAPIVDAEARNEQAQAREALTPLIGDSTFSGATVTGG
ncbi:MAG: PQQ-binding-like beta-propeller repeat protein, partial [Pseudomonadota bacterium]